MDFNQLFALSVRITHLTAFRYSRKLVYSRYMNMVSFVNIKKGTGKALEKALQQRFEAILDSVTWLGKRKLEDVSEFPDSGFDFLVTLALPEGGKAAICVECKSEMRPRAFRMVAEKIFRPPGRPKIITPVLALPWVSPGVAEVCQANQWSWFDLAGNYYLDIPGLLRISHTGNEPSQGRPRPSANLGTAEAARILRALLMSTPIDRPWTQHALREACRPAVSIGLVNKVVRHLRDEDFLVPGEDGGFRIRDPFKLLSAWSEAYRFRRHARVGYFTLMQDKALRSGLAKLGWERENSAVYAVFSAAELQAPNVRQPKTWVYVRGSEIQRFEKLLDAKQVDSGENIVVLIPEDDGVFTSAESWIDSYNHLGATHPIQTYVDLLHAGGRGKEAAEALLEQRIKSEWARQGFTP